MEDQYELGLTKEDAIRMDEKIEQMFDAMRRANEQMACDLVEIERLKAQTGALLADLQRMLGGSDVETILRTA